MLKSVHVLAEIPDDSNVYYHKVQFKEHNLILIKESSHIDECYLPQNVCKKWKENVQYVQFIIPQCNTSFSQMKISEE